MKEIIKDEIEFNSKSKLKRAKNLITALDDFDDEDDSSLPSYIFNSKKKKDKEEKEFKRALKAEKSKDKDLVSMDFEDEWAKTLSSFKMPKTKKKSKGLFDDIETAGKKKKKKKDKGKNGNVVNHKKEFEPELILLRNLQLDQSRFVDSLQKKYNQMEQTKSQARGVGKFTTDLIMSITSARGLEMQLVDKIISTKKSIADLDFKERKEFGSQNLSEQQNMSQFASNYLKQMMVAGRNNLVGKQDSYDSSYYDNESDTDDLFDSISESLSDTERSEDAEKFLEYENRNIKYKVIYHESANTDNLDELYDFIAVDSDGNIVSDYPLPEKTKLTVNRSTNIAKDKYGNSYEMIFD